ncbi:DUF305 domain-containing protein [Nostoc sp. CENA543]|uniref:DUF305 domain-containing protein n=1 Tax=Nostoc sp. CENA543 TaxID=1869241 RepID=UPI000CA1EF0B|nr:DUF305 domain-containing protein [Nostoc sp. CENA543]AUT00212.1 DUF305 domain-containing protein [Nostoc sp. CENA543]
MITMQLLTWKNSFLAFSLALLTACSTTSQAQNQNSQHHMNHHDMNHSGSNHNMAMDLGPADANYDLRFIDAMIPHHQGALNMANVAKQKSTRPEIKQLADEIIKAQTQEINQMKQWRKTWYPKADNQPMAYDAKMGHMMPMSSEQMQSMMMDVNLGEADAEFDLRFINAMIPHHEAAVVMAKDALQKSQRPEIKNLAQAIIKGQNTEINQMQQWRKTWYKSSAS